MKSYPYSFSLQKKQSSRQYCKIYFFGGEKHKKTQEISLILQMKISFLFSSWSAGRTILPWEGEILDGFCILSNCPDGDGERSGKLIQTWEDSGDFVLMGIK